MTFPERLRGGAPVVAAFSMIASPIVVELLAKAGFDAVVFDTEHGPLGPESLNLLIPAARAAGIFPIVRVRKNDPTLIGAALDVGAAGVLVPQIDSADAAAGAVSAGRFGPGGHRGSNPYVRAAGYRGTADWFARANGEAAMIVMVEGRAGIAALPGILATPQLDRDLHRPVRSRAGPWGPRRDRASDRHRAHRGDRRRGGGATDCHRHLRADARARAALADARRPVRRRRVRHRDGPRRFHARSRRVANGEP